MITLTMSLFFTVHDTLIIVICQYIHQIRVHGEVDPVGELSKPPKNGPFSFIAYKPLSALIVIARPQPQIPTPYLVTALFTSSRPS